MTDAIQDLVEAIHSSFRGVSRGEITIHEAEVIDAYGTAEERLAARRLDDEKRWEEIPDRYIEECPDALPHLDPQSWCYYIPRYMEWALTHYETSESIAVDNTIYALLLTGSDRGIDDHLRERFRKLTFEQSRTVSRFLRFMARNDDHADAMAAAKALQRYWSKFSVSLGGG